MGRFNHIWAKSPADGELQGESLVAHTRRVWKNLLRLHRRSPSLHTLCATPRLWCWASLAVLIHDLGKCCPSFQAMLRGIKPFPLRHEILSAAFLPCLLDVSNPEFPWIAAAVLSHHKDLAEIDARYRPADLMLGTADQLECFRGELTPEFYDLAASLFCEEFWPLLQSSDLADFPGLADRLTATCVPGSPIESLRAVLDAALRLSRSLERQPYDSPDALAGRFLRGLLIMTDHAGSAWEQFGFAEELRSLERTLQLFGLNRDTLYDHQNLACQVQGSAILTAPTGSGKTEAAMLWASGRASEGIGSPVLFYVLPYQASLNAMRARLGRALGKRKVTLQHSRAVHALYRQLLERDYDPRTAASLARRETALARLHVTPVRLLTPYQILRAAFQLKGHEAIWTDTALGLMVFDEIHAYEPTRLGMILATLKHLTRTLGLQAFIMSATLPSVLQRILQTLIPDCPIITADSATHVKFRRHRLLLEDRDLLDEAVVDGIVSDARAGLAVLAVATTVGRAQALWDRLTAHLGPEVQLLHGRFHAEDRFAKELALLRARGASVEGELRPVVLVATQVVEVSLNVDFDVLYSDPAPFEALLQRFGRVNRRRRVPLRDVKVMTRIPEGSPVYSETSVRAALAALNSFHGNPLDEAAVQPSLDAVYAGEAGATWNAELERSMAAFETQVLSSLKPFESDDRLEDMFEKVFDGFEVLPRSELAKYEARKSSAPLEAPALLVPITSRQFFLLKRSGRLERKDGTWVANCPYSPGLGLEIKATVEVDGV